jgi:hypothetical protein
VGSVLTDIVGLFDDDVAPHMRETYKAASTQGLSDEEAGYQFRADATSKILT